MTDRHERHHQLRRELERLLALAAEPRQRELERLAELDAAFGRDLAALLAADAAPSGLLDGTADRFLGLLVRPGRRDPV